MRTLGAIWVAGLLSGCSVVHPHRGVGPPIVDTVIAAALAGTAVAVSDSFGQPNSGFAQTDYPVALGSLIFVAALTFATSAFFGFTARRPHPDDSAPKRNLPQDELQGDPPGSQQTRAASCRSDDDCGAGSLCTGSQDEAGKCIPSVRAR